MFVHVVVGQLACESSGCKIHLTHERGHAIVIHRNGVGIKRIGSEDIDTRVEILPMYRTDDFGARDVEQVVIAFERSGEIGKLFATVIRFGQFKALYHRPHPSVEDQDALVK